MKNIILFILIIANFAIFAEDKKGSTVYVKGVDLTVDSATLKNGLAIPNSLIINNLIGGTTNYIIPATNTFKGKGIELGTHTRHSGLLATDFALSFATLFADSNYTAQYSSSSARIGTGSSAIVTSTERFFANEFTSNRLQTANIKVAENIYLFHDSGNRFIEGLAIRLGGEIYGNEVKTKSPYSFGASSVTLNGTTIQASGIDASSVSQLTYNEAYLNAVAGIGYNLKIAEGHSISLGYEYLKSVANSGNYKNRTQSLIIFTPTIVFPSDTKTKGKIESELEGNRISVGYRFDVTENISLGLSYSHSEATHKVVDSKVKGTPNFASLLTSGTSGAQAFLPLIVSYQPGFGPFPENKDIRRQIGFEVAFKF